MSPTDGSMCLSNSSQPADHNSRRPTMGGGNMEHESGSKGLGGRHGYYSSAPPVAYPPPGYAAYPSSYPPAAPHGCASYPSYPPQHHGGHAGGYPSTTAYGGYGGGYPPAPSGYYPHHGGGGGYHGHGILGMGAMVAGGAAAAYGAHHLTHSHGGYHRPHHFGGKFKKHHHGHSHYGGKFKRGKHGMFGGKHKKWWK